VCSGENQRADLVLDTIPQFFACPAEIEFLLKTEPEVRTVPEVTGEPQGGIRGDGTPTRDDGRDPAVRDTGIDSKPILRQVHFIKELAAKDFAGMGEVERLGCVIHFLVRFSLFVQEHGSISGHLL
jgi:hypothetical protein